MDDVEGCEDLRPCNTHGPVPLSPQPPGASCLCPTLSVSPPVGSCNPPPSSRTHPPPTASPMAASERNPCLPPATVRRIDLPYPCNGNISHCNSHHLAPSLAATPLLNTPAPKPLPPPTATLRLAIPPMPTFSTPLVPPPLPSHTTHLFDARGDGLSYGLVKPLGARVYEVDRARHAPKRVLQRALEVLLGAGPVLQPPGPASYVWMHCNSCWRAKPGEHRCTFASPRKRRKQYAQAEIRINYICHSYIKKIMSGGLDGWPLNSVAATAFPAVR